MGNPIDYPVGAIIKHSYTHRTYQVIEHTSKGLSKMLELTYGYIEIWNSYNNPVFLPYLIEPQILILYGTS